MRSLPQRVIAMGCHCTKDLLQRGVTASRIYCDGVSLHQRVLQQRVIAALAHGSQALPQHRESWSLLSLACTTAWRPHRKKGKRCPSGLFLLIKGGHTDGWSEFVGSQPKVTCSRALCELETGCAV